MNVVLLRQIANIMLLL